MANQIRILLTLDGKQYEAALNKATGQTKGFETAAMRTGSTATVMADALRSAGLAFSVLGAVQVVRSISQAGIAFERIQVALRSVSDDSGQAAESFAFVLREADRLGLEIESTAQGYVKLAAATRGTKLEGQETERIFTAVSHAAAKLSLSATDTAGVLRALSQIASKGTLSAEELRQQLGDRLPGAFQLAAQAMGVTTARLNEMLVNGEIMSEEFLPRFAAAIEKAMGLEQTERINTTTSAFMRFRNELMLTGNDIATSLNPRLAETADYLTNMLFVLREKPWLFPFMISPGLASGTAADIRREQAPAAPTSSPFSGPVTSVTGGIDQYVQGLTTPPSFPNQVDFYGQLNRPPLNEDQKERLVLLREELALIGMTTETEKARYQISEGRFKNETREAKEAIIAIAAKTDAEKQAAEAEKESIRLEKERVQTLERLRAAYDPYGTQIRQLTLNQEALTAAYARHDIEMPEYQEMLAAINQEQDNLLVNTQELTRAQYDLQLAYVSVAEEGLGVLRQAAGESRSTQLTLLAFEKTLAITRIMISTEVAAMRALAEYGPTAGEAMAARIRSLGYVSMALVAASGAIEAGQISGGRERGGRVNRGGIYEIGERGKPELLESGGRYYLLPGNQQGTVSPARSGGAPAGASQTIVQIHNSSGMPARTEKTQMPDGRELVKVFIGEATRDLAENGPLARGISRTFGLQRRPVTR